LKAWVSGAAWASGAACAPEATGKELKESASARIARARVTRSNWERIERC